MNPKSTLSLGLCALLACGATWSQDTIPVDAPAPPEASPAEAAPEQAAPAAGGSRLVEEIIVTAQKREENAQDVPISVQAFSPEALDARGVSDAINLPTVTPGMVYSSIANYSIIYIRGIGTDAFVPSADASIATYIDGVFFPFSHGIVQSFGAVERVEVLKGPQGTLFGRNTTGGAINVITRKPGHEFEASMQTSYGSFDALGTRAYVNLPLTDTLAMNVSALYNLSDTYYELTDDSPRKGVNPLPHENEKGARVRVKWDPSDSFDITLSGILTEQSGIGSLVNQNTAPNPQYVPIGVETTPDFKTSIDADAFSRSRNPVYYGEANWRTSIVDIKGFASHQDITTTALVDYDATKAPLVSFIADQFARVNTQELQFLSNDTTPFADHFQWIVGLYHIKNRAGFDRVRLSVGRDVPVFEDLVGFLENPLDPASGLGELLGLLGGNLDGLGTRVDIVGRGLLDLKSTAGYFQGTFKLPYETRLTLGGRYQTERRTMTQSRDAVQFTETISAPLFNFADQSKKSHNFSPKVSLDWRPVDDVMLYTSFQKGFKSGTYNILNIYTPTQYIEPEKVTAYEIGAKTQFFDRRLTFNAALFRSDIDNLQVQFISLLSGGAVRFETAPKAQIKGAEFDMIWQVAPEMLPGLVATANGSYLHARYKKYPDASGFTDDGVPFGGSGLILGGGVLPGRDFAGNKIVRSPTFSGTIGLSWTFNVPGGSVEAGVDNYHNSGFYYSAQNLDTAKEGAFDTLDARISYLYDPWQLRVTAFGKNLTDARHGVNKLPTDIGTWTLYAPSDTYGVRLNWDFGA